MPRIESFWTNCDSAAADAEPIANPLPSLCEIVTGTGHQAGAPIHSNAET